jgi:YD repeat-containing protein
MPRALSTAFALAASLCAAAHGQQSRVDTAPQPAAVADAEHTVTGHQPLHKGGIDLFTGLYVRQNEDLVVDGAPALILRRTYLSRYHASKQFGIGALHNGEEYLIGDGEQFQWTALILASGTRIQFKRTSPGTSLAGAEYVHIDTPSEWYGAKMFWAGLTWILEKPDGSRMIFKGCGPLSVCSIIQSRDPEGHMTHYRRDLTGTLLKIDDGGSRWISFEYDNARRITRAYASTGRWVRYAYDERGRLSSAMASDGRESRYTYTDLDELATIEEPDASIENIYLDGRCIRQVNRYPDADPYTFEFAYRLEGGSVVQTEERTSSGRFEIFKWNQTGQVMSESVGSEGYDPIVFDYLRDAEKRLTAVTVTCPDFGAGAFRRTAAVTAKSQQAVKATLAAECMASAIRR